MIQWLNMGEILNIDNLSKRYDERIILENVSFSANAGEIIALLGASGSGKTTLLRIIAGLDRHFTGSIKLFGQDSTTYFQSQRVAIVLQRYANFPWLSVLENLMEALRRSPLTESQKHIAALEQLDAVGLLDVQHQHIRQLSGGMQQRVALSRALLQAEPLICLDEPLAALDFLNRNSLQDLIRNRIRTTCKSALFVSHDIDEALYIADRILIIRDQAVRSITLPGKPREIDQSYKETAAFLESKSKIRLFLTRAERGHSFANAAQ
jgi:ABC-type nitrate/sulfonate/bicarbonate transport system ATPase subunit